MASTKITVGTRETRILMALQSQPMATYQELADLTGYSKSYVFKTLKKINIPNQPPTYFVSANPKLDSLNLEMVQIFFRSNNTTNLKIIEQLIERHPYSMYRARCFGNFNGIFCQFRIPKGTLKNIEKFCSICEEKGFTDSFHILELSSKVIYTTTQLSHWDSERLIWIFNWKEWLEPIILNFEKNKRRKKKENSDFTLTQIESKIKVIPKEKKFKDDSIDSSALSWINSKDVAILAELYLDARRKEVDIISRLKQSKNIDFTPQTFSRHIRRIKEECVDIFRVFIDPSIFDIFHTLVIHAKCSSSLAHDLAKILKEKPIPFNSSFKFSESEFSWYLRLPSNHLFALLAGLQPVVNELNYYAIDKLTSAGYTLWHQAFDDVRQEWRQDENFMVKDVFKILKKEK